MATSGRVNGVATDVSTKGEAADDLALLLAQLEAEDDFAGLHLHLFIWVDDESKQAVRKTGIVTKEDVVKGEMFVLPVN